MRDRIVRHFLFTVLFMLLLFWPGYSSFGQSNANYDLCSDINHIDVNAPLAVTVDDAENIYIAEAASNSVHIYDMGGFRLRSLKGLSRPVSVAVAPEGGLYVGNSIKGESNVAVYDNNLDYLFKLGSGDGEFKQPTAIAVSPVGKIYVVDRKLDTVKVYYPDGSHDFSFGSPGSGEGQFNSPTSIAIYEESVLVTDLQIVTEADGTRHEGARFQRFSLDGDFVEGFNKYGQGEGFLTKPLGVATDGNGNIFVADSFQNVVQVFNSSGAYQTTVYSMEQPMRTPLDLTFGPVSHRLYVASLNAGRVDFYCPPIEWYSVAASVNGGGGSISANGVTIEAGSNYSFQVAEQESITFAISADNLSGYYLEKVLVDGIDAMSGPQLAIVDENEQERPISGEYTFSSLASGHTIEALFALSLYTITADVTSPVENCGAISPSGPVEVSHGDSQTFTTTFDPVQCDFLDLVVDGESVGSQESWTFSDLSADHTVRAVFGPSTLDSDGDGIPDYWEIAFKLDPDDPSDGSMDSDGDGGTNLNEFLGGTDPYVADVGAVKNDFNGDGKSDILTRSVSSKKGTLLLSEMAGSIITESNIVKHLNHVWEIAHVGDFTGDNKVDILIRHSVSTTFHLLEMDGAAVISEERVSKLDEWDLAAAADFTGEGKEDILVREKDSGHLQVYVMDGHNISSRIDLGNLSPEWDVVGAGDFNGDGKSDILLRDSSEESLRLYEMNGGSIVNDSKVADIASSLIIAGIADFTGDKKADILIRDANTGSLSLYRMDGPAIISRESIGDLSLELEVAQVGDYSGDGKADILLRDTITGELRMYEMDGSTILANNQVGDFNLSWQPQ